MKKRISAKEASIMAIIALAIISMAATFSSAYYYNINHSCQNNICVRGETAVWNISIHNDGNAEFEVLGIEIYDTLNNTRIASMRTTYNPYSDRRGNPLIVHYKSKIYTNLSGNIPAANVEDRLYYYACITTAVTDSYINARDEQYESRQCFNKNETMPVLECLNSGHCGGSQYCSGTKCYEISCGECQYIFDHSCRSYECCDNSQCAEFQKCENHGCQNLDCNLGQFYFNHTCRQLECKPDEFIKDRACKKLDCLFDEYAFNGTCRMLDCPQNEYISNHTCKKLECKEYEAAKNHKCVTLNCLENESIISHACRPLDCYFFQDIKEHACVNNGKVITKFSIEIFALALIVAFVVIDFRKRRMFLMGKIMDKKEKLSIIKESVDKNEEMGAESQKTENNEAESGNPAKDGKDAEKEEKKEEVEDLPLPKLGDGKPTEVKEGKEEKKEEKTEEPEKDLKAGQKDAGQESKSQQGGQKDLKPEEKKEANEGIKNAQ